MTKKLIALVRVSICVDGVHQECLPGSELPELAPNDAVELIRMGAIEEQGEAAQAEKTATRSAGDAKKK